jgi:hypothetical protein
VAGYRSVVGIFWNCRGRADVSFKRPELARTAFEDIEAEIGLLLTRMQNQPADLHELHLQIMHKLNELKAYGMPLPNDLVELERQLEAKFAADREQ